MFCLKKYSKRLKTKCMSGPRCHGVDIKRVTPRILNKLIRCHVHSDSRFEALNISFNTFAKPPSLLLRAA